MHASLLFVCVLLRLLLFLVLYPCYGFAALLWLPTLKPCIIKTIGQLKYQMQLNFQLYAPSVCVLRNAPAPVRFSLDFGWVSERIFQGKSSPLPEYSPFLFTALNKTHCEGIEVARDSSKFHDSRETQTVEKGCCSWD